VGRSARGVKRCVCGDGPTHHTLEPECWGPKCLTKPEADRCIEFRPVVAAADLDRQAPTIRGASVSLPRKGTLGRQVYDAIIARRGLTDDDLEYVTGRSHQSVSSARNRLMEDGLIYDTGEKRTTRHGADAAVWKASRIS
jgi:hypothetical protein